MFGDGAHAPRMAHDDDDVSEVFGKDMQMEHGPVIVDDEFGTGNRLAVHGDERLKNKDTIYFS
jgi:hypothetical protein